MVHGFFQGGASLYGGDTGVLFLNTDVEALLLARLTIPRLEVLGRRALVGLLATAATLTASTALASAVLLLVDVKVDRSTQLRQVGHVVLVDTAAATEIAPAKAATTATAASAGSSARTVRATSRSAIELFEPVGHFLL